jgi:hypothetical protein
VLKVLLQLEHPNVPFCSEDWEPEVRGEVVWEPLRKVTDDETEEDWDCDEIVAEAPVVLDVEDVNKVLEGGPSSFGSLGQLPCSGLGGVGYGTCSYGRNSRCITK